MSRDATQQATKKKHVPYRYRWAKQCVCGAFLPKPAQGQTRVTCGKCGQEHEVGR